MDATDGIDVGLSAVPGAAPFGAALSALQLHFPVLSAVGCAAPVMAGTLEKLLAEMTAPSATVGLDGIGLRRMRS